MTCDESRDCGASRSEMKIRLMILVAVAPVAAVGCGRQESAARWRGNEGPLKPCTLPGIKEELLCGKLTVFENREKTPQRLDNLECLKHSSFVSSRRNASV